MMSLKDRPVAIQEETLQQLQAQIEDLQTRLAFQEDTLQVLNDVIASQDRLFNQQQRQLRQLGEKYDTIEYSLEQVQGAPGNERPPHY